MKDRSLKDRLVQHYWSQKWYVQPEVPVYYPQGLSGKTKLVTDVDVLALRPTSDLRWEKVLGDCKAIRNISPVNRALWIRGLMDYTDARSGLVLLSREADIETDHRLLAASLGVTLAGVDELDVLDQAVVYPRGSQDVKVDSISLLHFQQTAKRFPRTAESISFLHSSALYDRPFGALIRKTMGELRSLAKELDPNQEYHVALALEAAGVLALGIAECVGVVFHTYLHPQSKDLLDSTLRVLIWEGRERYEQMRKLRAELLEQKGVRTIANEDVLLPLWDKFIELVRSMLDHPRAAFEVPWHLRRAAVGILRPDSGQFPLSRNDLPAVKFAFLVADYVSRAAGFHSGFTSRMLRQLTAELSNLSAAPAEVSAVSSAEESKRSDTTSTQLTITSASDSAVTSQKTLPLPEPKSQKE